MRYYDFIGSKLGQEVIAVYFGIKDMEDFIKETQEKIEKGKAEGLEGFYLMFKGTMLPIDEEDIPEEWKMPFPDRS